MPRANRGWFVVDGNLSRLREKAQWKQQHLAVKAGVAVASISDWENGANISERKARALAKALAEKLKRDEQEVFDELVGKDEAEEVRDPSGTYTAEIPVMHEVVASPKVGQLMLTPSERHHHINFEHVKAAQVRDTSMVPVAFPGQFVMYLEHEPKDGELAIVRLNSRGMMFKRYYRDRAHNLIKLQSVNPTEEALLVEANEVQWAHRVVGVWMV